MKSRVMLAASAVLFVAPLVVRIDRPFLGHREGVCTQYAIMAQTHLRLGYGQTRLASYEGADIDPALVENWRDVEEIYDRFDGKPPCAGVIPIGEIFETT